MKRILLLVVLAAYVVCGFAQDFSNLNSISLDDSIACKKAEPQVLACANYLLARPFESNLNNLNAIKFIMSWMEKTSNFSFTLDEKQMSLVKSDDKLLTPLMSCQAATAINLQPKACDKEFQYNYIKLFLEYCEKPASEVKLNSKLKKLIAAKNDNTLREAFEK